MKIIDLELDKQERQDTNIIFEEYLCESINKFIKNYEPPESYDYIAYLYTYDAQDYMLVWNEHNKHIKFIVRGKFKR